MPITINLVQGSPQAIQANFQLVNPVVRVLDTSNVPMPNVAVQWNIPTSLSSPGATFNGGLPSPQNSTTDVNGIATMPNASANGVVGTWNVAAKLLSDTSIQLSIPIQNINDLTNGTLGCITIDQGNLQSKPTSTAFTSARFIVTSHNRRALAAYQMRISRVTPVLTGFLINGGTVNYNVSSDGMGRIVVPMTSGTGIGSQRIRCQKSSGDPYGIFCDAQETVFTAGTPAEIQLNAGNNQSVNVSAAFPLAMKAKVVDANGAPLAGLNVTFTNPASGPSALFSNVSNVCIVVTDVLGIATSLFFTANATAGTWGCIASTPGVTSAIFTQSNMGSGAKNEDSLQFCEV